MVNTKQPLNQTVGIFQGQVGFSTGIACIHAVIMHVGRVGASNINQLTNENVPEDNNRSKRHKLKSHDISDAACIIETFSCPLEFTH